ncbi:hypothetical protein ACRAWF_16685 [Streptomyces sp. L7]
MVVQQIHGLSRRGGVTGVTGGRDAAEDLVQDTRSTAILPRRVTSTDGSTAVTSWCALCSNCPCGCGRWCAAVLHDLSDAETAGP